MTPKQRMLAAYRGEAADTVPVAPEFWYYVPAKLLGVDMVTFEREVPLWEALQRTFHHYGTEGWACVGAGPPHPDVQGDGEWTDLGEGRFEARTTWRTPAGSLTMRQHYSREEPSWAVERPIKVFERDWAAYRHCCFGVVEDTDWSGCRRALDAVGEDYLLEVMVGVQFTDFIANPREGGLAQGLYDLLEHEAFFEALHEEYLDYLRRFTRAACQSTTAESLFIGCSWSCLSLISPALWRRWDKPVIQAVAEEAHAHGRLVHLHYHGRCRDVLADLAESGADCICPFERPPGGDIADVAEVRDAIADRVTMNGNVHTVETLIRGTPADVRREVEGIFEHWRPDLRRLILGTGDQVGRETPDENLAALIETGRELGKAIRQEDTTMRTAAALPALLTLGASVAAQDAPSELRLGLIGLDTSHVIAFTSMLNDPSHGEHVPGAKVVAAVKGGSPDIPSSISRVEEYSKQLQEQFGVEVVDSIPALCEQVDGVLITSLDGRPHLEQARQVIAAGKPFFVDKPVAGTFEDCLEIARLARQAGVPWFGGSSLRWWSGVQEALDPETVGDILGCDAFSPCSLEPHHPDLFWYGVHGVEILYAAMGRGCKTVQRASTDTTEVVIGVWADGRIGTFRGTRSGKHDYGGTFFGTKGITSAKGHSYKGLVEQIVRLMQTKQPPMDPAEIVEEYGFMQAADESKRQGGAPVPLPEFKLD